jgi:hypothetical protein
MVIKKGKLLIISIILSIFFIIPSISFAEEGTSWSSYTKGNDTISRVLNHTARTNNAVSYYTAVQRNKKNKKQASNKKTFQEMVSLLHNQHN